MQVITEHQLIECVHNLQLFNVSPLLISLPEMQMSCGHLLRLDKRCDGHALFLSPTSSDCANDWKYRMGVFGRTPHVTVAVRVRMCRP